MAHQKDATVYIGRFNPFHFGHAHVLEAALKSSTLTIVLVGSSGQARSLKNPFTFEERRSMIEAWHQSNDTSNNELVVLPLLDHPYNDALWIKSVQDLVKNEVRARTWKTEPKITITGSDRDESTWYLSSFPQWLSELQPEYIRPGPLKVSATSVREIMYSEYDTDDAQEMALAVQNVKKLHQKVPSTSASFILKFMDTPECALLRKEQEFIREYKKAWSVAPYEPIFSTTDAVLVQSGHVLVVVRGAFPGEGLWALPGGFVDPKERLQACAVRELMEETGIRLAEGKRSEEITRSMLIGSIKDKEIFDKPDRSSRGRTITTAFLMQLDDTKPLPKVKGMNAPLHETGGVPVLETRKAFWLPISDALAQTDKWFEDHLEIVKWGVSRTSSK